MVVESEIDVVGLGGGRALAVEVKCTELNIREAERILPRLDVKTEQIRGVEECILGVMAKKIDGKKRLREEGFMAMDLEDMVMLRD